MPDSGHTKDGGPAFPLFADGSAAYDSASLANEGMSLRDWFAGQAMAAMIAGERIPMPKNPTGKTGPDLAAVSYEMADNMILARKDQTNG